MRRVCSLTAAIATFGAVPWTASCAFDWSVNDSGAPTADAQGVRHDGSETSLGDAVVGPDGFAHHEGGSFTKHDANSNGGRDAGRDGGRDATLPPEAGGVCSSGVTMCTGSSLETCIAGQWGAPAPCGGTTPFCAFGACSADPPSCLASDGGPTSSATICSGLSLNDCCSSPEVAGGMFSRSYDDVTFRDATALATVSMFRLDGYEATVARFRQFVAAVVEEGWVPTPGSGKHSHLNDGSGLAVTSGGFESGWRASWPSLPTDASVWNTNLSCGGGKWTWTPDPGENESSPIDCITWYEAYAFCIYDGGFLPSEAEWNFAAAGGSQRVYPWSSPSTETTINCNYANYDGGSTCPMEPIAVGTFSPQGDGNYGQSDLAGNVWEWMLDSHAPYVTPCTDCTTMTDSGVWSERGGSFTSYPQYALVSYRGTSTGRFSNLGVRCARTP